MKHANGQENDPLNLELTLEQDCVYASPISVMLMHVNTGL